MEILIIEDDLSDLKYYLPLSPSSANVSLLFVAAKPDYTIEKTKEHIELIYENAFSWIKHYFVCNIETIKDFLEKNAFDFYILDSLDGRILPIIKTANLSKEKIALFSGTTAFRELTEKEGYRAYRKEDFDELIKNCLK